MISKVYTMPPGIGFLPALARGLIARYGQDLDSALILLPTRRAVRELTNILISGESPRLLPRMRPLADINPDEPPFEPGYMAGLVSPAMPTAKRRFELARLIGRYYEQLNPDLPLDAGARLALADPLLAILDDAAMEEADLAHLSELEEIRVFAAEHFQNAALFYKILQNFWPQFLNEQQMMEPMARRVALLNELTQLWAQTPPAHPVIIAGSTGTLAATARLMACVADMPNGLIVLPGLDKSMPEAAWAQVGAEHPQNSLKKVLGVLGLRREEAVTWPEAAHAVTPQLKARRLLISESLVPVASTADWTQRIETLRHNFSKDGHKDDIFIAAWQGLSVIEAHTDEEEALSIALILRRVLNDELKTAALITPDPALARRVRARLRRWQVDVDYSQGEPLEETQMGAFLSAILDAAQNPEDFINLARLAKHSLSVLSEQDTPRQPGDLRRSWDALEKNIIRNPWPAPGQDKTETLKLSPISGIHAALADLMEGEPRRAAQDWALALGQSAQMIAGALRLWQGEAGEKAVSLLDDLITYGAALGEMPLSEFARLFGILMRGKVVRPRFGTHPRLQILGPLEARLIKADVIVLGGLNEGVWPAAPTAQPFLSRAMRKRLGLSLPERRFGLAAHDFAELATQSDVYLTRARRSDDSPRVASRWLWRLQTLTRGALKEQANHAFTSEQPFLSWARQLDFVAPGKVKTSKRPEPRPKLSRRWPKDPNGENGRRLSITQIKSWIRDPYAIYARKVLRLRPLSDLSAKLGPSEYGSAIHKALERFLKTHQGKTSTSDTKLLQAELNGQFERALSEVGFPDFNLSRERVRLQQISADVISWMQVRRAQGWQVAGAESAGRLHIKDVDFTLTGRADLIEKSGEGFAVIDFKTGKTPTAKVVRAGFDPQLPLTAYMLRGGGFEKINPGETSQLIYMKLKGAVNASAPIDITQSGRKAYHSAADYADEAIDALKKLIRAYDDETTAYYAQPRIQYVDDYGQYDHLSRRGEWALLGEEGFDG